MANEPNTYDAGDPVRIRGVFTVEDEPTDPTTVRVLMLAPGETESAEIDAPASPETGTWETTYQLAEDAKPGLYRYRMEGTGAAAQAEEGRFKVRERSVPVPPA